MESEHALLTKLAQDDQEALETVMRRYTAYVITVLRRNLGGFGKAEDVEEMASNTFYALWRHRKRLQTTHLRGWLGKVAANEAKGWLRKQRLPTVSVEDWFSVSDVTAERLEDNTERRILVTEALLQLDEQTREIFTRYYAQRQTVEMIAEALHMKPSTVKSRLRRGRQKMKSLLEDK